MLLLGSPCHKGGLSMAGQKNHLSWVGYLMPWLAHVLLCIAPQLEVWLCSGAVEEKVQESTGSPRGLPYQSLTQAEGTSRLTSPLGFWMDWRRAVCPTLFLPETSVPFWPQSGLPSAVRGNSISHRCLLPHLEKKVPVNLVRTG